MMGFVFFIVFYLLTEVVVGDIEDFNYLLNDLASYELTTGTLIVDTNCASLWYLDTLTPDETTITEYLSVNTINPTELSDSGHVFTTNIDYDVFNETIILTWSANVTETYLTERTTSSPTTTCSDSTVVEEQYGGVCFGVLYGFFENVVFNDSDGHVWNYSIAVFPFNGSVILNEGVQVVVNGLNSFRLESTNGSISIGVPINVSGFIIGPSEENYAGGFGDEFGGPGAGGAKGEPGDPNGVPGGGGFGGKGGSSFEYTDEGMSLTFGKGYSDVDFLIGGSAGGKWDTSSVYRLRGGGAIELRATDTIYINSSLSAAGQSGLHEHEFRNCVGGGSGGMLIINAPTIILGDYAYLDVSGGSGSFNHTEEEHFCASGGAGGVVQFYRSELHVDDIDLHITLHGGEGRFHGEDGIFKDIYSNSSRGSRGSLSTSNVTEGTHTFNYISVLSETGVTTVTSEPTVTRVPMVTNEPPVTSVPTVGLIGEPTSESSVTFNTIIFVTAIETSSDLPPPPEPGEGSGKERGDGGEGSGEERKDVGEGSGEEREDGGEVKGDGEPKDGKEKIKESTGEIKDKITGKPHSELKDKKERELFVNDVVDDFDSIVDETDKGSSEDLSTLVYEVEDTVSLLAKSIQEATDSNETIVVSSSNIAFEVVILIEGALTYEGSAHEANQISIRVPHSVIADDFTGDIAISHIIYSELGENLDGTLENAGENDTYDVNGRIVSTTIQLDDGAELVFDDPVEIIFENFDQNARKEHTQCVYWQFNDTYSAGGVWSSDGCNTNAVNRTHTTCHCTHLTSFCVLLQVTNVQIDETNLTALNIITYVGLSLSLFTLIITLVIMVIYFRRLNYECTSIHINLVTALIIADALFLFGIDKTANKTVCVGIAIFMHYFFLVVFMWMAVEAMHMYSKVRSLNQGSKRNFYIYYPIGWGIPCIIVIITMAVRLEGYSTDTACWLAIESGTIWAFIGPVICIILLNLLFIGIVLKTFTDVKSIKSKPKKEQIRRTLRAAVILLPIFGLTWVFGLLAFNKQTLFFQYMFALFNSLQGFFIFLFHCCLNVDIKNILCSRWQKRVADQSMSQSRTGGGTLRTEATAMSTR